MKYTSLRSGRPRPATSLAQKLCGPLQHRDMKVNQRVVFAADFDPVVAICFRKLFYGCTRATGAAAVHRNSHPRRHFPSSDQGLPHRRCRALPQRSQSPARTTPQRQPPSVRLQICHRTWSPPPPSTTRHPLVKQECHACSRRRSLSRFQCHTAAPLQASPPTVGPAQPSPRGSTKVSPPRQRRTEAGMVSRQR